MATGRIGVTPTLGVRWSKAPASGTTSLSGLDDSSVSLVYSVGYEQVYRNGVLLSRGNDYTATTGTTVVLTEATIAGDLIEIFAQQLVPLTDAISKGQFTAKGTLLSATAASTPGVLSVGANDTVLTADSTAATGLKWATPASGGESYTLLNTGGTTLSGSTSTTISGISNAKSVFVVYRNASSATAATQISFRINGNTSSVYDNLGYALWNPANTIDGTAFSSGSSSSGTSFDIAGTSNTSSSVANGILRIDGCSGSGIKPFYFTGGGRANGGNYNAIYSGGGIFNSSSTISSITIIATNSFNGGTIFVYTSA